MAQLVRAPPCHGGGHGFESCRSHLTNSFISYADVAQLAEQLICNQQVNGSSPFIGFLGKRKSLRKAKDSEVMNDDLKGILERQFANSVCSLSFALQMTLPFLINLYKQACKVH